MFTYSLTLCKLEAIYLCPQQEFILTAFFMNLFLNFTCLPILMDAFVPWWATNHMIIIYPNPFFLTKFILIFNSNILLMLEKSTKYFLFIITCQNCCWHWTLPHQIFYLSPLVLTMKRPLVNLKLLVSNTYEGDSTIFTIIFQKLIK